MKEIKAYIRPEMGDRVISELEANGVKGMTILDVSTLGGWTDPENSKVSIEYCEKYCSSLKIELVCEESDAEKFINVILDKAHTGRRGDGKIFVSDITNSISIRTKQHGAEAL